MRPISLGKVGSAQQAACHCPANAMYMDMIITGRRFNWLQGNNSVKRVETYVYLRYTNELIIIVMYASLY